MIICNNCGSKIETQEDIEKTEIEVSVLNSPKNIKKVNMMVTLRCNECKESETRVIEFDLFRTEIDQ